MRGFYSDGSSVVVKSTGYTLTPRQLDVMQQVAKGLSNQEIADTLMISERTVRTHISDVLGVLQVNSRTAALVALGWVRVPVGPDGPSFVPLRRDSLEWMRGCLLESITHLDDALGKQSEVE
jgi:DNA-binding CsgD family transcriptional regulator